MKNVIQTIWFSFKIRNVFVNFHQFIQRIGVQISVLLRQINANISGTFQFFRSPVFALAAPTHTHTEKHIHWLLMHRPTRSDELKTKVKLRQNDSNLDALNHFPCNCNLQSLQALYHYQLFDVCKILCKCTRYICSIFLLTFIVHFLSIDLCFNFNVIASYEYFIVFLRGITLVPRWLLSSSSYTSTPSLSLIRSMFSFNSHQFNVERVVEGSIHNTHSGEWMSGGVCNVLCSCPCIIDFWSYVLMLLKVEMPNGMLIIDNT